MDWKIIVKPIAKFALKFGLNFGLDLAAKCVAKKLCPSSKTIATIAAEKAQKNYNGIDQAKRDLISRYADKADSFNTYAKKLRQMIADGKIDDLERDQLAEMLEPLIEKAKELVFDK